LSYQKKLPILLKDMQENLQQEEDPKHLCNKQVDHQIGSSTFRISPLC